MAKDDNVDKKQQRKNTVCLHIVCVASSKCAEYPAVQYVSKQQL